MTTYKSDNIDVTVTVTLHPFPTDAMPDFTVARYAVVAHNLNGDHDVEGSTLEGRNLYHDEAYRLLKLAGVPWRDANNLLSWSYDVAINIQHRAAVTS